MNGVNRFEFAGQMAMADVATMKSDVSEILLDCIPGAVGIRRASEREDLNGTDLWVDIADGRRPVSVDVKARSLDPFVKLGKDDLALESFSMLTAKPVSPENTSPCIMAISELASAAMIETDAVYNKLSARVPWESQFMIDGKECMYELAHVTEGWTLNSRKNTDYVLWSSPGRNCLVPFLMLNKVFRENWISWRTRFDRRYQFTKGREFNYNSECIFVPRRLVWEKIFERFAGSPASISNVA